MVVRGLATAPRLEAVRQLVRGTARRRGWRSAGLYIYTLCPSLQCSGDQLLQGGEVSEDTLHRTRLFFPHDVSIFTQI